MARVKRAVQSKKRHKATLERAKGYYGNKSRSYRAANEQVMHSLQYAYRDRRARKGESVKVTYANRALRSTCCQSPFDGGNRTQSCRFSRSAATV